MSENREELLREVVDWFTDQSRAYDRCKACDATWWARVVNPERERHNRFCFVPRLRRLAGVARSESPAGDWTELIWLIMAGYVKEAGTKAEAMASRAVEPTP